MIEDELSEKILMKQVKEGDDVKVDFDGEKLTFTSCKKEEEKEAPAEKDDKDAPDGGAKEE